MADTKAVKPVERWTLDKQAAFLERLAATCNVAKACRAVKMGAGGVYKLRMKSKPFRDAWDVALREGYVRLEMMMLERAIEGTVKPVFQGGKQVGEVREYDPRMAMTLLSAHRGAAARGTLPEPEAGEAIRARLAARFGEMEERLAGEG